MEIAVIREKILTDNSFVEEQISVLSSYYQLKHTHRWAHLRTQDETESVAEHVYGMHILCSYFAPLMEDIVDLNLCREYINWHDMAEALVGDMTSRTKTDAHRQAEKVAEETLVANAPDHLHDLLSHLYATFDTKSTPEARFVKALDKIEPMFHLYFLSTKENDLHTKFDLGWSADEYRAYRATQVDAFPILKRFDDVLYEATKHFHPSV